MTALSASRHDRAGVASIRELDWLMLVVVALCCLGLVMAVSVRGSQVDVGPMSVMRDQGSKLLVGLVLFLVASIVPMRTVRQWALPLFVAATVACLLPLVVGQKVNGAYRWIKIGSQTLQPVEPARFFLIIAMSWLLAKAGSSVASFRAGFLPAMGCAGMLVAALVLQPDNGNALIIIALASFLALIAGVRLVWFLPFGAVGLAGFAYVAMQHEYVRRRIAEMASTPHDGQVGLGLIAVGSGGAFGRGIGQGWMKMNYVPEAHNDFVFAIVAEEFGFAGSLFVLLAFTAFGWICCRLVCATKDRFLRYVICGYSLMICMQAAANLLVVSGWAPAKGIDLPFVSTGGTSLVFCLAAVGLIGNAARSDRAGTFSTGEVLAVR
jgi:cell division protein FtsW